MPFVYLKLPDEILKMYQSYEKYGKSWKASELRNVLLFFSTVVLKSLLPNEYYRHWLYLVNCCRFLQKKTITQEDLQLANILFFSFIGKSQFYTALKMFPIMFTYLAIS
jgi:hypothetical protein